MERRERRKSHRTKTVSRIYSGDDDFRSSVTPSSPVSPASMSDSDSTPTALSEANTQLLRIFGGEIVEHVEAVVTESIFCSIYGIIFALAVYSILRNGLKSRGRVIMLIIVVYLYASAVAQFVLDVLTAFDGIYYHLMVSDTPFPDRLPRADESLAFMNPPLEALFMFSVIIGDGVVIWRTWAIYQRRLLAILMPSILLLGLFISVVLDTICYNSPTPGVEPICPWTGIIFWTLSIATNITCTTMIGFKAWQHRRMMRELNLSGTHSRTKTERILSLLVESGFIYIFLWATEIIVWFNYSRQSPLYYAFEVISPMGNQIAGMYPTLIIVIVNFRRTFWEDGTTRIGNDISLNTLQWNAKRGPTDTLATEGRVDVHRETVTDSGSAANVKHREI